MVYLDHTILHVNVGMELNIDCIPDTVYVWGFGGEDVFSSC